MAHCVELGIAWLFLINSKFLQPRRHVLRAKGRAYRHVNENVMQFVIEMIFYLTRNTGTLDCDLSNYSSRIGFSHKPIEFGPTGHSSV